MDLKIESDQIDRHTFLPPSNIVLPDSIGNLFIFFFVLIDI